MCCTIMERPAGGCCCPVFSLRSPQGCCLQTWPCACMLVLPEQQSQILRTPCQTLVRLVRPFLLQTEPPIGLKLDKESVLEELRAAAV